MACVFFFFQAEDGIRDLTVTGVQTCALPICRSLGGVRRERSSACEQHNDNIQGWTGMSENLDGEKRAPDWSNDGMDSVPDRINPGNFICEKFEEKKNAGNNHDDWLAQNRERLILWGKNDPVEMNGKASGENSQVKI